MEPIWRPGYTPKRVRRGRGPSLKTWLMLGGTGVAVMGAAGLAGLVALSIYTARVTADLPEIEDLARYEPPVMTRVHAGDGKLIAEYARESRVFVPIETIPPRVIQAFLSAEDKNFYEHDGVDYQGMIRGGLRSLVKIMRGKSGLESGSTITQQVAKNFKLTSEQTLGRKIQEIELAKRLEKAFSKDEILELYLNEIYLGRRAYGVAAAALLYFGKPLDELSLSETAYLAALPKAPSRLDITHEDSRPRAMARRNYVLERMAANGFISEADRKSAASEQLAVAERLEGSTYLAAEYFVEEVRRLVFSMYGEGDLYDGGLSVRTTLDTGLQVLARRALREGLEEYDRRYGYRGPIAQIELGKGWEERLAAVETFPDVDDWRPAVVLKTSETEAEIGLLDGSTGVITRAELFWARTSLPGGKLGPEIAAAGQAVKKGWVVYVKPLAGEKAGQFALRQIPDVNGAILAMDPHTGRVLAMVGGYSYRQSQFNRATQARRQPGSAFKPFAYAAALDAGKTPVSKVLDAAYVSPNPEGLYKPSNYSGRWYGLSTLRLGIEQSRNTMTVRLATEIGLEKISAYGERFKIYDKLPPYESMALGAGETTLWRLTAAYSMLVNGGKEIAPTIIDRVQDRNGKSIYRHDKRVCEGCMVEDFASFREPALPDLRPEVLDPVTSYQVVSMLHGVVERGTAHRLAAIGKPLAGKTGTTNDFRDAWFVGFSPDLVVGVYVGADAPRPLGDGESGGRAAVPIFETFMKTALADTPAIPFRIPPGVRLVRVNARTGDLARPDEAGSILEAFRPGTEPTRFGARGSGFSFEGGQGAQEGGAWLGADGVPPQPGTSAWGTSDSAYYDGESGPRPIDPSAPPAPMASGEESPPADPSLAAPAGAPPSDPTLNPALAPGDPAAAARAGQPAVPGKPPPRPREAKREDEDLSGLY